MPKATDLSEQIFANSRILSQAANSSEAISQLFLYRKQLSRSTSLQSICRKGSIPSTGYLSDVMKGKRTLHKKYKDVIGNALGLTVLQTQYLALLIDIDHATKPLTKSELSFAANRLKSILPFESKSMPADLAGDVFFHFVVFSSISLLGGNPTFLELCQFFGPNEQERVGRSLEKLVSADLVNRNVDRYSIIENKVLFQQSENGYSHLDFLRSALTEVGNNLEHWFDKRKESLILSTLITTRREEYLKKIPRIKAQITELLQELDSGSGDMILQFHTHIFPVAVSKLPK